MTSPLRSRITILKGNIVEQRVDAIVNAANSSLLGGGGVDGAIHRAAGRQLLEACRKLGGCPTGEARITPGFQLAGRFVIHTVGPVYSDGHHGEPELLASAYRSSLQLAEDNDCRNVAFPSISTGAYRFPIEQAAEIAQDTILAWLKSHPIPESVIFVLFSDLDLQVYQETFDRLTEMHKMSQRRAEA